jgi:hypothetical protein
VIVRTGRGRTGRDLGFEIDGLFGVDGSVQSLYCMRYLQSLFMASVFFSSQIDR